MSTATAETNVDQSTSRWVKVDRVCEEIGDKLNPILVKETRQALKSRQFVTTFSVLLFAALAWTVIGSLSLMPDIYTEPSAPRLLIGYYIVLAIPMLLVVPLAAYRSLEGEIDDGTLELLSITTLSPWYIVLGKLASACLQMVLYFVALFPCVAYAYTLRGVDLPTTLLIIFLLVISALFLTIVALFFAPLSRSRTGRIVTLLSVITILLVAEWGLGWFVIETILQGNPFNSQWLYFLCVAAILLPAAVGHLLLTSTAAQLTPESENRSTQIRLSTLMVSAVTIGLGAYAAKSLTPMEAIPMVSVFGMTLCIFWTATGAMMCAESPVLTPRIRRELPDSFLARAFLTWLTPGPATGLVFASVNLAIVAAVGIYGLNYLASQPSMNNVMMRLPVMSRLAVAYCVYVIGLLIGVRWIVALLRINNNPRVEIGIAALLALGVMSALLPYSIALHYNDYRPFEYSNWQITNWAWTLEEIVDGRNLTFQVSIVAFVVLAAFLITLFLSPKLVFPRRIAMPKRVLEELAATGKSKI